MRRIYLFNMILIIVILIGYYFAYSTHIKNEPVYVGVLFSESGYMADSERPMMRATLLAINEINQRGGVDGKQMIPVIYDAESNINKHGVLAKKMILDDHVDVIFGCWTSASRKIVKPIVEKYNNLLIYSSQTEGVEESKNIINLGAIPNQQLVPAVFWMLEHYGKKVYLVGSDQISPHVENEILAHQVTVQGGQVVGVDYFSLGTTSVDAVINDIIQKKPDVIFSIINGSTNIAFYNRLYALTTEKGLRRPPVMTFSLSESAIHTIGMHKMVGDLASWSYFKTEDTAKNNAFLAAYQKTYGSIDEISDPAATSYAGVYLWAQAANQVSVKANLVRNIMLGQSLASPMGPIYIDPNSAYTWRTVEIAQVNKNEKYEIVWRSAAPIEPIVYPDFKTKAQWEFFEYNIYTGWNNSWHKL